MNRPKGYENRLVVLFALVGGIVMLDRAAILFLFPIIVPELQLQMWQAGAIASGLSIAWAISSWVFGSVSDYKGRRVVLLPAVFLFSVMSWATGIASSFVQVVAARVAMGAAEGPIFPVMMGTVAEESTPTRRGFNLGAINCMAPLMGLALGPIIVIQLAASVGWRMSFFIVGIPGIVLGIILWRFVREPGSVLFRRAAAARGEKVTQDIKYVDIFSKNRNIWLSSLYTILQFNYLVVFTTFGMLYLTNVHKLSMMEAGMTMAGYGIGGFLGVLGLPALSDHIGQKPASTIFTLAAGIALLAFVAAGANMGLLFALLLFAGFCYGALTVTATVATESVPIQFAATAAAIPLTIGEILGSTVMPVVAGGLADMYGLTVPMYVAAGGAFIAAIVTLFYKETAPKVVARRAGAGTIVAGAGPAS